MSSSVARGFREMASPSRDDVDNIRVDALRNIDNSIAAGGFVTFDAGSWSFPNVGRTSIPARYAQPDP
jgi:hypothetical protein